MTAAVRRALSSRVEDRGEIVVSIREVGDVTFRLLCAAGVPAGCAARAAAMVQHSEVHRAEGLRLLHAQLGLIERGGGHPAGIAVAADSERLLALDAAGRSALAAGPPALDLAFERAATLGLGAVWIRNAHGLALLDELPYRAASRGRALILSFADPESATARTVVGSPGEDGVLLVEGKLPGPSLLHQAVAAFDLELLDTESVVEAALAVGLREEVPRGAAVVALAGAVDGEWVAAAPDVTVRTEVELRQALQDAARRGVSVRRSVWQDLYGAACRVLVRERDEQTKAG